MSIFALLPWFRLTTVDLPLPVPLPGVGAHLPVPVFGALMWFGLLVGLRTGIWFAKRTGVDAGKAFELGVVTIGAGLLGAGLFSGLFYYPERVWEVLQHPSHVFTTFFGLSSYGGLLGGLLGALWWRRARRAPLLPIGEAAAFCIPFGWFWGRVGCTVVHDHPGRVTDFPLAFADFHVGLPPYQPRHDLGFYGALVWLAIAVVFAWLARTRRPWGFYVGLLPLLYAPARFALDFLRTGPLDYGDARYVGLTPAQWISLVLAVGGWVIFRRALERPRYEVPPALRPRVDVATAATALHGRSGERAPG
ncbi:MAG: prolipoprotein diacylglyceryl transferase [Myxococcales bacterium]|nr:prolipoprotein diacylglyceryl transferase [Myxococcales bacterium]